jgi:hypothetical protein
MTSIRAQRERSVSRAQEKRERSVSRAQEKLEQIGKL